ncbi:MAG: YraN family protein [Clostridia bacterium]|nr:YraN family protein [Clostridia bacterium]
MYTDKKITGLGKKGEDFTAKYLRENGYIVIKQNFSNRYGEIDIIAENGDYIVFVEVKTRSKNALVSGVEAVDSYKMNRVYNLANDFLSKFMTDKPPRFDVADVVFDSTSDSFEINYIESAF